MQMIRTRRILKRLMSRGMVVNILTGKDGLLMDSERWEVLEYEREEEQTMYRSIARANLNLTSA